VPVVIEMTVPVYASRSLVVNAIFSSTHEEDEITKTMLRRLFRSSTWPGSETTSTLASAEGPSFGDSSIHNEGEQDISLSIPTILLSGPDDELDWFRNDSFPSVALSQQEKDVTKPQALAIHSPSHLLGSKEPDTHHQQPIPFDGQRTIVIDWLPLTTPKACTVIRRLLPSGLLGRRHRTIFTVRGSNSNQNKAHSKHGSEGWHSESSNQVGTSGRSENHSTDSSGPRVSIGSSEHHDRSRGSSSKQYTSSNHRGNSNQSFSTQEGKESEEKRSEAEVIFSWRTGVRMGVFKVVNLGGGLQEVRIRKGIDGEDEDAGCWG
jgi:hypothetical protein